MQWVRVGVLTWGGGWGGAVIACCVCVCVCVPMHSPPRGHLTLAYGNAETRSAAGAGAGAILTRRVSAFLPTAWPAASASSCVPPAPGHLYVWLWGYGHGEQHPALQLSPHLNPLPSSPLDVPP